MANRKIYVHELIDIRGHNRARYMHHMTANWCPVAREQRNQLCFGVWGTVGSTGRWPEVVNMWELDGWEGLAADLAHELSAPAMQDAALAQWWSVAASMRRGGVDRLLVPAPWGRSIDELLADGVRGVVYAHEMVTLPVGLAGDYLSALHDEGLPMLEAVGLDLVGAFRVAMVNDSECVVIWACPTWSVWTEMEQQLSPSGTLSSWRSSMIDLGAHVRRSLMVDAPLGPLRIGRQPRVEDRVPLDEL